MKRILFVFSILFFLCLGAQKSFAQGNLQFNQVLTGGFVQSTGSTSSSFTVPVGKVWKIEAITSSATGNNQYFQVNGNNAAIIFHSNGNGYPLCQTIWLKAGDSFSIYNNSAGIATYFYSIIEFNIVP